MIKAIFEVQMKIYSNEMVEMVNDIINNNEIQMLKQDMKVNSLVGILACTEFILLSSVKYIIFIFASAFVNILL